MGAFFLNESNYLGNCYSAASILLRWILIFLTVTQNTPALASWHDSLARLPPVSDPISGQARLFAERRLLVTATVFPLHMPLQKESSSLPHFSNLVVDPLFCGIQ